MSSSSNNPLPNPPNPGGKDEDANNKKGYYASSRDYVSSTYNAKYETWMPWIEDKYLAWFGKDNKASYVAKGIIPSTLPFSSLTPSSR